MSGGAVDITQFNLFNIYSATNDWQAAFNGRLAYSTTTNTIDFSQNGGGNHIGATSGFPYYGDVSEVVLYDRKLTTLERQRVNTYLGIKYGLPIGHNYLAGDGTTIYNVTTYGNNVFGIGRDDCQGLNQKQSKSTNTGVQPIFATAGFAATNQANTIGFSADKSFLIAGSDAGAASFGTLLTAPAGLTANNRFTRIWKVQETGTVGSVKFAIAPIGTGGTVYLVRSTDATFDATDTWIPLSNLTVGGTNYLAGDINFNDGDYFTLATYVSAPGCVAANLKLWLKADAGTTLNSGKVSNWTSIGVPVSVAQANAAKQPALVANGMNFNPALDFAGAQVLTNASEAKLIFTSTTDPVTLYGVMTNRNNTGWWKELMNFDGNDDYPSPSLGWVGLQPDAYIYGQSTPDSRHATSIPTGTPTLMFARSGNASPSTVRLGFNGLATQQTYNNATGTYVAAQNEFAIGAETDALREPTDGLVPELIVYNRELTD